MKKKKFNLFVLFVRLTSQNLPGLRSKKEGMNPSRRLGGYHSPNFGRRPSPHELSEIRQPLPSSLQPALRAFGTGSHLEPALHVPGVQGLDPSRPRKSTSALFTVDFEVLRLTLLAQLSSAYPELPAVTQQPNAVVSSGSRELSRQLDKYTVAISVLKRLGRLQPAKITCHNCQRIMWARRSMG